MNKDILFFHVPKNNNYYRPIGNYSFILYPPVGLLGLADYLSNHKYTAGIVDIGVEHRKYGKVDLKNIIEKYKPEVIGIGLHWHFQSYDVIETARKINNISPKIPIILGGFTASYFAEEILKEFNFIDFVIKGDSEVPLVTLVTEIKTNGNCSRVPNLVYRKNGKICKNDMTYIADEKLLNSINFTNFTFIKDYDYFIDSLSALVAIKGLSNKMNRFILGGKKTYSLCLGRGCVLDCSFCGGSKNAQKEINNRDSIIFRSVDATMKSIIDLEKYGFEKVLLGYDPLSCSNAEAYYFELFEKIIKTQGINLSFEIERWTLPTESFIKKFKECLSEDSSISLSPNSHSEEIRKKNNLKYFSNPALEQCLDIMEKLNVKSTLFFASGLPFETKHDMEEMVKYHKRLKNKYKFTNIRTCIIEIEPCSNTSQTNNKLGVAPLRKSFLDYYQYHSRKENNQYQELGYIREGCPEPATVRRFFCDNFCPRFKAGRFSWLFCHIFSLIFKSGFFHAADKFFQIYGNISASLKGFPN